MRSILQITKAVFHWLDAKAKKLIISLIPGLLILLPEIAFSQQPDSRYRLGVSLTADITERWSAGIGIEQRQRDNFHQFDKILVEPEIKYTISQNHSITAGYRGWAWQKEGQYGFSQWVGVGYAYSYRLGDWKLKYSSSAQYDLPETGDDSRWDERLIWRNKLGLKYSIFGSRFTPEVRMELFTSFEDKILSHNQLRTTFLVEYRIGKTSSIEAYLIIGDEMNTEDEQDAIIYGLSYCKSLSFK